MSLVSVIIPVYNSARWLSQTLESVLSQDYLKEIICIDDHSTDESAQILLNFQKKYPDIIKVFTNPKKGSNTARNFGFTQSTGKYIQWLDADDQLLPGKFKAQVKYLEQHPECDIVYSDWYMDFYDSTGKLTKRKKQPRKNYPDYLYELLKDNWSPPANYLLRRKIAENLYKKGLWNEQTKVAQDREYFTIAALEGAKFCYVTGFFSVYNRWSNNQISSIDFKKRLELQIKMEKKFHDLIIKKNFPRHIRKKYLACLNAHILNACFYHPRLTIPYLFPPFNVNWKIIHWKKYPFISVIYIWQILKFCLTKVIKN